VKLQLNEAFWLPEKQFFALALDEDGNRVEELSVLATVPLWFDLLDAEKVNPMLDHLADADHATDWGMRIISSQSRHYGPAGYHFGSVWPLFTGWASVGEYRYHRAAAGYANLQANALLALEGPLGHVTEVLSGATHTELPTSSPHQIWSAAMVVSPLLRGLLGLEQNASANRLVLAPHLPATWDWFEIRQLRVGGAMVEIALRRSEDEILLQIDRRGPGPLEFQFSPAVSPRAEVLSTEVNDRPVPFKRERNSQDQHLVVSFPLSGGPTTLRVRLRNDFALHVPADLPSLGASSRNLKLLSQAWNATYDSLEVEVSGRSGSRYRLPLRGAEAISRVEGTERVTTEAGQEELWITFPETPSHPYSRRKIRIEFTPSN
jgi:hypothetical protein